MFFTYMDLLLLWKEYKLVKSSNTDLLSNTVFGQCEMRFGITARKANAERDVCWVLDGRSKTGNLSGGTDVVCPCSATLPEHQDWTNKRLQCSFLNCKERG